VFVCTDALAALSRSARAAKRSAAVLAAGTDDRDPAPDLARHDAYPTLDSAGALFRPGLTGTYVMDVVIGIG
jgi:glycerate-2-kinase